MDDLKTELNEYLFRELDVDGDEANVSENWPFALNRVLETSDLTVFEFHADEAYFALADESLNFMPQAGMTVADLLLQRSGAEWIGARDPVGLSVVRLGDPSVPPTAERRRQLDALAAATVPGESVKVLEGLFLCSEQRYLALCARSAAADAIIAGLPGPRIVVSFPQASSWRRLAWGVGHWLTQQGSAHGHGLDEGERVSREPLGLESKAVRVVPYDDRWPALFEREAARIADAVAAAGLPDLALEHVGSTAVPGLAAKPVLDISAGYAAGMTPSAYVAVIESLDYVYRGNVGLPGREFFRRGEPRSHHLHLVEIDGTHWRRFLRFRDALRADAAVRDAYAALKHALAVRYPLDRESYILGKTAFVESVLDNETSDRGT